jgi:hypothetical protein
MQKRMVFILAAITLLAFSCGKKAPAPANPLQGNAKADTQAKGQLLTLNDILAMGKSQKCTVSYTINNVNNQATVYLDGKNVHMDTTYQLNGAEKNFSLISNGEYAYLWTNDSTIGFKVPVPKNSTSTLPSSGSSLRQDLDPNHQYQYDCSNWTVDSSEFTPPSSIRFSQMGMPQAATPNPAASLKSTGNKAQACAACNYAGSGKAQCLASLGCN